MCSEMSEAVCSCHFVTQDHTVLLVPCLLDPPPEGTAISNTSQQSLVSESAVALNCLNWVLKDG